MTSPHAIVYVEDNPSNVALMNDLLADFESVVLSVAETAELGIELVRALRPDIVIMDINLPGMSGFEATRVLASSPETRDIPVIALSASPMMRDAAALRSAGFHRYLTKPVNVDQLTSVLEELLTAADEIHGSVSLERQHRASAHSAAGTNGEPERSVLP